MKNNKKWCLTKFNELTVNQLYEIIKLRTDVFIVEQNCAYMELDNLDQKANTRHLCCYENDELLAYLRILKPDNKQLIIGRVVVAKNARNKGLGNKLLNKGISYCKNNYLSQTIKVSAQAHLKNYYQQHGFKQITNVYLEDDIPHIGMLLTH